MNIIFLSLNFYVTSSLDQIFEQMNGSAQNKIMMIALLIFCSLGAVLAAFYCSKTKVTYKKAETIDLPHVNWSFEGNLYAPKSKDQIDSLNRSLFDLIEKEPIDVTFPDGSVKKVLFRGGEGEIIE